MPELNFQIDGVEAVPYAASPTLVFKLRVSQSPVAGQPPGEPLASIHSVILRCQIRLDPARRRYTPAEQDGLNELFGETHRWGQTVRSMLWTNAAVSVPAFTDQTVMDLTVPCTWDFNIAGTKYFGALADGEVPLSFLFSGTIFYAGTDESLQVSQISWEKEAAFRLPVRVWKQMMDLYYPNIVWLGLRQDVFERLKLIKTRRALADIDQVIEMLLERAQAGAAEQVMP